MGILSLFFSFQGRIGRLTFFWASSAILVFQFFFLLLLINRGIEVMLIAFLFTKKTLAFFAIYLFLFVWMNCALMTKRFHDIGQPGWMTAMMLGVMGIPLIGLYGLWLMGQLFAKAGDMSANEYGPPPGSAAAFSDDESDSDARQLKAFAAIDALARGDARPAARLLPGAAPMPSPVPLPPAGFRQRSGGFGRRQSAPV